MEWKVKVSDEYAEWWESLNEDEQIDLLAIVNLLKIKGPTLPFPYSSGISGSKHDHMRELRIQHSGDPYRVLYAFDPTRSAILLIGGNKTGNKRWYEKYIPIADKIYDKHIMELNKEAKDGKRF